MLTGILGKELIRQEEVRKEKVPGVVTGLAWTPVGGEYTLHRRYIYAWEREAYAHRPTWRRDDGICKDSIEPCQITACKYCKQL